MKSDLMVEDEGRSCLLPVFDDEVSVRGNLLEDADQCRWTSDEFVGAGISLILSGKAVEV